MTTNGLPRRIDAVVIGGGQSGLIATRLLAEAGRDHLVLERRETLGGGWQDRWDEFRLVSPNWTLSLPGRPYDGDEPDGFMPRDEIVGRLRGYAEAIAAPVHLGVDVTRLRAIDDGDAGARFRLETNQGPIEARDVLVATGGYPNPRIPEAGAGLSPRITQVHAHHYRREADLPPGAVLVVGSGQTGAQLTEELLAAGRRVILAMGRCGRVPRRYRGRDVFRWLRALRVDGPAVGASLPTVADLPDPSRRLGCNPYLSGHDGGHTVDLRRLARDGLTLVGRMEAADGERVAFAPGAADTLAWAEGFFEAMFRPDIERLIDGLGLDAPPAEPDERVEYEIPDVTELDLAAEGVSTVLWTSGYRLGFDRWIDLPVLDDLGFPLTTRGVSEVPGLRFLGMPWQVDQGSANLIGVVQEAEELVRAWD